MKSLFTSFFLLLVLLFACVPAHADSQGYPTTQILLTTSTSTVAASSTTAVTSQVFSANPISGFAVVPKFVLSGTANNTGTVTFGFAPSLDGTTFATTTPISVACTATGTTTVIDYINVAPYLTGSGAANAPYWRLKSVANPSTGGAVTINSITISKSNR